MGSKKKPLGRVELEILQFVVENQPTSVKEVANHMAESSGQARTTVLTVLERLREKKYVKRRKIKGINHYAPTVDKNEFIQGLVGDFVEDVMQGSVSPFVAYLDQRSHLTSEEQDQLRKLVAKLDRQESEDQSK